MKKLLLVFALMMFCFPKSYSQKEMNKDKIMIKWNLSSLVDYTPSLQFGVQYHLIKNFHLQHELGFISHRFSPFWESESELIGFRLKNTIKYYLPTFSKNVPIYLGFDLLYKHIRYNQLREYSMYQNSYFQMVYIERTKTVFAGTILLGFEPFIIEDKLFLDFYAGLGYRRLFIEDSNPPENGVEVFGNNSFRRSEGLFRMPNISLGMRIGLMINRRK